jgi:carbonic anhydrase/acetyltransferase-like protein (isoleucine patch superfamily)
MVMQHITGSVKLARIARVKRSRQTVDTANGVHNTAIRAAERTTASARSREPPAVADRQPSEEMTMTRASVFLGALLVVSLCLLLGTSATTAPNQTQHSIDPTAEIHPSVILEGKVTVGPYTRIDAGTIVTGDVTIGHHTLIRCNVTIRGTNVIGNYTHIYDNVNIEGGRPAKIGSCANEVPDRSVIGDYCWINHGAVMHGTQIGDEGAVGLSACCDYNTRIGKGAVLANGSATHVDQVIPENSFAEGVPAVVKQKNITDKDRQAYFGLIPAEWSRYDGANHERKVRGKK